MIEATGRAIKRAQGFNQPEARQAKPSQEATGKSSLAIWTDSYRHSLAHCTHTSVGCGLGLDATLCVPFGYLYCPSTETSWWMQSFSSMTETAAGCSIEHILGSSLSLSLSFFLLEMCTSIQITHAHIFNHSVVWCTLSPAEIRKTPGPGIIWHRSAASRAPLHVREYHVDL